MQVKITNGKYRNTEINGTFTVFKPWQDDSKGGHITIHNDGNKCWFAPFPRVTVLQCDILLLDDNGVELAEQNIPVYSHMPSKIVQQMNYEQLLMSSETDEEAMDRIRSSFTMLDKAADSVAQGTMRGLIVSGPPGVGKSFGVEKQLEQIGLFSTLADDCMYQIVTGCISAIGLYQLIWNGNGKGRVICFDDCDKLFWEEDAITILKGALNSGARRTISYNKESRVLAAEGIPKSFEVTAGIIFLTNLDFENVKFTGRVGDGLKALVSRCHYLDLEIGSVRDRILRIKQIVADGMLNLYNFQNDEENIIVDWVVDHKDEIRELSLRMVSKLADLVKSYGINGWEEYANSMALTREARFKIAYKLSNKEASTAIVDSESLLADVCVQSSVVDTMEVVGQHTVVETV